MEKQLIGRGVLSGAVAGLLMFAFARIFAEPVITKAINYESAHDAMQSKLDRARGIAVAAGDHEIFTRTVQADLGLGVGLILFGAAMGALVAVAYVIAVGRINVRAFPLALLVPAFGFAGVYLVPFAKYPANPPAIGHPDTIRERGADYLIAVFCACLFLFLAVYVGQRLHQRLGLYRTCLGMGVAYLAVMTAVFVILPAFSETPAPLRDASGQIVFPGFPADVLAQFRVYSLAAQAVLWGVIALTFAPLAQRVLEPRSSRRRTVEPIPAS